MTFEGAIAPYKFHEVAPYITRIGFGAQYASALTVNLSTWNDLPADVQTAITEAAAIYGASTATENAASAAASVAAALAGGAKLSDLSPAARAEYAAALPDIAGEWAAKLDAQGAPGTRTLAAYMRLSKEAGIDHARDWGGK